MDTANFGGMGTWLIILILFLFMGWNGFGGFGAGNAAWLMNSNNNHDNTVDIINNNTQWSQQLAAQQNLANQTTLITQGFCGVNNNIEKKTIKKLIRLLFPLKKFLITEIINNIYLSKTFRSYKNL